MQELVFWLIVIPIMSAIGVTLTLRSHRPVKVDYKRLPPTWQSGVVRDYQPSYTKRSEDTMGMVPPRLIPPQSVTSGITDEIIASNNAAIVATGLKLVEHGYLTEEQLRRDLASVDIVLSTPSTGYTPLLDDDPYEHEEETGNEDDYETWNQALLRNIGKPPVPRIDLSLIGKEYH